MAESEKLLALLSSPGNAFYGAAFGLRDALDIIIVAFLVYAIIRLIQQAHLTVIVSGIVGITALYVGAIVFDLPFTRFLLQPVAGISLILITIVFQREIRRFFSLVFRAGRRPRFPSGSAVDIVSHFVFSLAKRKIGALIVLPGREPIDRFLEGGFSLRGELSEALLFSIFDESSPGHDGAVVLEGNCVKKFAVHLPLAERMEKARRFGLRHRAALGLTERSDAVVIVVSGERGSVFIAQAHELYPIFSAGELKEKLLRFCREHSPRRGFKSFFNWFTKHPLMVGISLTISFVLWLFAVPSFSIVQRNFVITPTLENIPAGYSAAEVIPEEIILTIRGRGSDIDSLDSRSLKILLNLAPIDSSGKRSITVSSASVKLPLNLDLVNVSPKDIEIRIVEDIR